MVDTLRPCRSDVEYPLIRKTLPHCEGHFVVIDGLASLMELQTHIDQ